MDVCRQRPALEPVNPAALRATGCDARRSRRRSKEIGGVEVVRGAQGRNRTTDTWIFSPLLYQLSYLGKSGTDYAAGLSPTISMVYRSIDGQSSAGRCREFRGPARGARRNR